MHVRDLAERGFVGFAIDMYGEGCRGQPCGPDMATYLRAENPTELRRRAERGLQVLAEQAFVNSAQIGANGYCFGGTVVPEMARAAMPVVGVVSFHGGLVPLFGDSTIPADIAVQVHTGDLDPITENDLDDMNEEMRSSGLTYWSAFIYGNCAHGWTDPNSGAYRQREADESHEIMFKFYPDVFNPPESKVGPHRLANVSSTNYTEQGHVQALDVARVVSAATSPLEKERQEHAKTKAALAAAQAALAQHNRQPAPIAAPIAAPIGGHHLPDQKVFGQGSETWN